MDHDQPCAGRRVACGPQSYTLAAIFFSHGFADSGMIRNPDEHLTGAGEEGMLEQFRDATATVWPGAGHYGFVDRDRWSAFLAALTSRDSDSHRS